MFCFFIISRAVWDFIKASRALHGLIKPDQLIMLAKKRDLSSLFRRHRGISMFASVERESYA